MRYTPFSLVVALTAALWGGSMAQAATAHRYATPQAHEAAAAALAARRGELTSPDAATLRAHALARCNWFQDAQAHADCITRMGPQASVQGSVAGGGDLREAVRTIPPAAQPPARHPHAPARGAAS